jgi:hypothetical protein
MMPAMLRDDIRIAYADVKPAGFNENPMQKIPIIICGNEGRVHMVDAQQGAGVPYSGSTTRWSCYCAAGK